MSALPPAGHVVVIGAGQAGHQTAASLRERGHRGPLTLVGDEGVPPYERPPLSKTYLQGRTDPAELRLRPPTFYDRHAITRLTGTAVALDRAPRTVRLADGTLLSYDHLVLATGASARPLAVPGAGLAGVHTLRTLRDADRIRADLARARHVVVVGAGFIGLEFAASARALGHEVTVVEALWRPLTRNTSAPVAEHLTRLHEEHGTRVLLGRGVTALTGGPDGRVTSATLTDGRVLPADLVLAGIGAAPRTELAEGAGLAVDGGIVTDARLLTGDPHISAVGDCALFPQPGTGTPLRVESVQNAVDHARLVADRLTGTDRRYDDLPWFWSHQFSATLQIAGLGHDHDTERVLRTAPDAFSVLLFREGALVAVESVNRPADHMAARRLLATGIPLTPEEASAEGFTLRTHLRTRAAPTPVPAR